jgi:internalin A
MDQDIIKDSTDRVAQSTALSKIKDFLENADKADTLAGKIIETLRDGIDTARKIAGFYNDIAQWCGLPQAPKPIAK